MRWEKFLIVLLIILLVVVIGLGGLLIITRSDIKIKDRLPQILKKSWRKIEDLSEKDKDFFLPKPKKPEVASSKTDSVKKIINPNNETVTYDLIVYLTEDAKINPRSKLIKGKAVLVKDLGLRKFEFILGDLNGTVYLGRYEEDFFNGNSEWKSESIKKAVELFKKDERIKLTVQFLTKTESDLMRFQKDERILDGLGNEILNNEFLMEIPKDYYVYARKAGVVE